MGKFDVITLDTYDPQALGAKCDQCVLKNLKHLAVPPEYHTGSSASIVTDYPREKETDTRRPLSGSHGIFINEALQSVGVKRTKVDIHNAIACPVPEGDLDKVMLKWTRENKRKVKQGFDPVPSPIECCRPRLLNELDHPNLVTLGKTAYHSITERARPIMDIRGGPVEAGLDAQGSFLITSDPKLYAQQLKILPTLHTGFVQQSRRWMTAFKSDLSRAFRWFSGHLGWKEPRITLNPTPEQLALFLRRQDVPYVFDVETTFDDPLVAKLKCIGISDEDHAMVVHFLSIEGPGGTLAPGPYTDSDELEIRGILRDFFVDETRLKVGHNAGYFDRLVVKNHFGVDPKPMLDTILLHRSVESELPHKLGYVGSIYTDVTAWKEAHTASEARNDYELGVYCLFHGTTVQFADGRSAPIHEIVEKKLTGEVVSRTDSGEMVARPIIGWHRNTVKGQEWWSIRLSSTRITGRGLITTPDHKIHTLRGKIPASEVVVGDRVFIGEQKLSAEQTQAIIGTCLGDSILVVSPVHRKEWWGARTAAISGGHVTESGFSQYKASLLPGFLELKPERPAREMEANGRKGAAKPFTGFTSPMLHQLAVIQRMFRDEDGTRRLRQEALEAAGAIGLAWWFMDDGCRQNTMGGRRQSVVLSTQRYPLADVDMAHRWLEERFGRIYLGVDKVLRFSPDASKAFGDYIAPHLPPIARYKLPQDMEFSPFRDGGIPTSLDMATAVVVSSGLYVPPRDKKHQRTRADTRYCIDVEGTHNFMTVDGLVQNCAVDCCVTARAMPKLYEAALHRGQEQVVQFDHKIQEVCVGLHEAGMYVDLNQRAKEAARLTEEMKVFGEQARLASGNREMNLNSTLQLRDLLYDRWLLAPTAYTKLGDPSTNDESLRLLRTANKGDERVCNFIDALRRYRRAVKEYGTYVKRLVPYDAYFAPQEQTDDEDADGAEAADVSQEMIAGKKKRRGLILADGRVHPDYSAHGTTSGRLSSSNMNAQNVPKHLRAMFIARPGHVLVGADADQLELRSIASVARIARYLDIFEKGGDPHAETAAMMFGSAFTNLVPKSDQWDKLRKIAKSIKYASFYGSGDETVHNLVTSAEDEKGNLMYPDLSLREVATLRRNWLKGIPELPKWWDDVLEEYRGNGFVIDPVLGRRRDFLDGEAFNEIVNFPIQSGSAHVIHLATFDLLTVMPFGKWGPGTGLIAQVHDALYAEVPCPHEQFSVPNGANGKPDEKLREFGWCPPGCRCEANWAARQIEEAMNRSHPGFPDVQFSATAKIAKSWNKV